LITQAGCKEFGTSEPTEGGDGGGGYSPIGANRKDGYPACKMLLSRVIRIRYVHGKFIDNPGSTEVFCILVC
jgi:hypothetical protein